MYRDCPANTGNPAFGDPAFLNSLAGPNAIQLLLELGQLGNSQSEDCLTLNVWSKPQTGEKAKGTFQYHRSYLSLTIVQRFWFGCMEEASPLAPLIMLATMGNTLPTVKMLLSCPSSKKHLPSQNSRSTSNYAVSTATASTFLVSQASRIPASHRTLVCLIND